MSSHNPRGTTVGPITGSLGAKDRGGVRGGRGGLVKKEGAGGMGQAVTFLKQSMSTGVRKQRKQSRERQRRNRETGKDVRAF